MVFGFSRGAYTARAVANVMNLCGIQKRCRMGLLSHAMELHSGRSQAMPSTSSTITGTDTRAVKNPILPKGRSWGGVFGVNMGAMFQMRRKMFKATYSLRFIGVFDTVAALGNVIVGYLIVASLAVLGCLFAAALYWSWHWFFGPFPLCLLAVISYWYIKLRWSQFKYFSPDPDKPLKISNLPDCGRYGNMGTERFGIAETMTSGWILMLDLRGTHWR